METTEKTKVDLVNEIVEYLETFKEGDIIEHEEFRSIVGAEKPDHKNYNLPKQMNEFLKDVEKRELKYLNYRDEVKDKLLKKHKKTFTNVPGKGYIILTPNEQVKEAGRILKNETRKAISKAMKLYKYAQYDRVSVKEKQLSNDNMAKAGSLRLLLRKVNS